MRIIAGSRKGARIFAPKGLDTRPTSDRVREAAFTLIPPAYVPDANVLDLFAGSGAMGLEALTELENVEVDVFSELVVEFARKWEAKVIVKGLRVISDFEWEFQMNQLNRTLAPEVETVYVMASPQVSFVSSSGVKEIAAFGGNVEQLVPEPVARRFKQLFPDGRPGTPERPGE